MKRKIGFTLIELLVVISIIAILAAVIVVNVNSARKKGRDTRRKADLTQVSAAIQLYYADNHAYPGTSTATFATIAAPTTGSLVTGKYLTAGIQNPYPTGYTTNQYYYVNNTSDYYLYFVPETNQTATCGVCNEAASQCTINATAYDCAYLIKTGQETSTP
jgi:type II secretion system protein G